jgi:uncharacterized protein (TIGR02147 family)
MSEARQFYYQTRLREALMERIDRNPRYSIRSFASALGLDSSSLSQILAGKRSVSTKVVDRILGYLELDPREQKEFLESIIEEKKQKGLKRVSPELDSRLKNISKSVTAHTYHGVGLDEFRVIADWYHYAILELTFSKHFSPDPKWIAKELGISITETKIAIDRLLELELLERKDGTLKKVDWHLDTKDKTKSSAFHRKRQKQILEKSMHSLEHDPIEIRNHSSLTLCIDKNKIALAKAKIQSSMQEIADLLLSGTPEEVYELSVNLFPLNSEKIRK